MTRALAGMLAALSFFSCQETRPPQEITVGVIYPASGPMSKEIGEQTRFGIQLAQREAAIKAPLVKDGKTYVVKLIFEDDKNLPDEGLFAARKLINQTYAEAIIGLPVSQVALPVALLAEAKRVPMISSMAGHPALTFGKGYVFRVTSSVLPRTEALAGFAIGVLKRQRGAALFDLTNQQSRTASLAFKAEWIRKGGIWVADAGYVPGQADLEAPMRSLTAARADAVFMPDYLDNLEWQFRQWSRHGLKATPLGLNNFSLVKNHEIFPATAYFSTTFVPGFSNKQQEDFSVRFKATYGIEANAAAAYAYDAYMFLWEALQRTTELNSTGIATSLRGLTFFPGITGPMLFSSSGTPEIPVSIYKMDQKGIQKVDDFQGEER